jgi:3-dehydrosphinganine reductase
VNPKKSNFFTQHAIVTGGSSGIGKATAKLLFNEGANLSIIARNPENLEAALIEIETGRRFPGQKAIALEADVSNRHSIETAIESAISQLGPPDLFIASAGIAHPGYFQDLPVEIFEETMAINYFGSLYCLKTIVPVMAKPGRGHVVLISSGAGLIGIYGYTPYCPSKFALRGLAESLRGELRVMGIGISIVYPPDTDTPQLVAENLTKPPETQEITGTAQMWTAQDVAQAIVRGIQTKSFMITPGLEMSILGRLHSLLSPGLQRYFDSLVDRTRNG